MATAPILELEQSASNSIAVIVAQNPAVVLVDPGKRDDLYAHIRREIEAFVPDITTNKGREAIKSFAFKIVRTKTAIDAAGKQLNEEARAKINVVDAARRDAKAALDQMAEEVRRPLTEWEEVEKARIAECDEIITRIALDGTVTMDDTSATVRDRGAAIWSTALDPERFGDKLEQAQAAKDHAIANLKSALVRLEREEADRTELARLRAENEAREAREREEREARETAKREAEQARVAEERRLAAEKADQERIERAKQEATEAAQREAEKAAQAERDRIQAEHEEALAAERARAAEAERLRQVELARIAEQERQREAQEAAKRAEEERVAAENAKRERNRAHRAQRMGEAKIAIMAAANAGHAVEPPITEAAAVAIVRAIVAGSIPHVSLEF